MLTADPGRGPCPTTTKGNQMTQYADMWALYVGSQTVEEFLGGLSGQTARDKVDEYVDFILPSLHVWEDGEWAEGLRSSVKEALLEAIERGLPG